MRWRCIFRTRSDGLLTHRPSRLSRRRLNTNPVSEDTAVSAVVAAPISGIHETAGSGEAIGPFGGSAPPIIDERARTKRKKNSTTHETIKAAVKIPIRHQFLPPALFAIAKHHSASRRNKPLPCFKSQVSSLKSHVSCLSSLRLCVSAGNCLAH